MHNERAKDGELDRHIQNTLNDTSRFYYYYYYYYRHAFVLTLNPIRRRCDWALLACEGGQNVESLPEVPLWVRDLIAQIL